MREPVGNPNSSGRIIQREQAPAPEDGGFEKAVLNCNLAGPEAFATDENGRYRYDQMRSLEQFWRAASGITQAPPQDKLEKAALRIAEEQNPIEPGDEPVVLEVGDIIAILREEFSAGHSEREQVPAPEQPKCDCGAGDDAYLACHAEKCSLRKWANPASEARSQAAPAEQAGSWEEGYEVGLKEGSERRSQAAREIEEELVDNEGRWRGSPKEIRIILDRSLPGGQ